MDSDASKYLGGLTVLLTVGLVSCVLALEKNEYYEYKKEKVVTANGELYIGIEPTQRLILEDGKEFEYWGAPYRLNAQYYPREGTVLQGEITDLVVKSVRTKDIVYSNQSIVDMHRKHQMAAADRQKKYLGFGTGLLDIPFDDYVVIFRYKIYAEVDSLIDEGAIEVVFEGQHYEARGRRGLPDY